MTKRLFIGTLLNKEQVLLMDEMRRELEVLFHSWWRCRLRFVKAEKLHTTWLFLGDVEQDQIQEISKIMNDVVPKLSPVSLSYDRLDFFGLKSRPNAMVLLPEKVASPVFDIAAAAQEALGMFCRKKDEHKQFRPHITILRFDRENRRRYQLRESLHLEKYLPLLQEIKQLSLIESHTGNGRQDYEVIAEFELGNYRLFPWIQKK